MRLERDGAELVAGGACGVLGKLLELFGSDATTAGTRLYGNPALTALLGPSGQIGRHATRFLGADAIPVRALLLDKSDQENWALSWHQDRVIVVQERHDTSGFGKWTIKGGMHHVSPPQSLLARMITMRIHLDAVPETNAPLLIARGSHGLGRIAEPDVPSVVAGCSQHVCLADAGDIWVYSTPILHASERAARPARRRVLQVDYAAEALPGRLEWLRIGDS